MNLKNKGNRLQASSRIQKLIIFLSILVLAGGFVLAINKFSSSTTRGNQPRLVFEEIRQWQIASDATTGDVHASAYTLTTGFNGNFNDASYPALNAYSNNGVYASTGFSDKRNNEYATNFRGFSFSAIPDGSVINSVNVYIDRKVDVANGIAQWYSSVWADVTVAAALAAGVAGSIDGIQYSTTINPTTDAYWNYSMTSTLPTLSQLKGANFGIRAQIVNNNSGTDCEYFIDDIYIVVDYDPPIPTVDGVIYSDEGSNPYLCSTTGNLTVDVRVNGLGSYTAECTADTGAFSVTGVVIDNASDIVTIFINEDGVGSVYATTVTKALDTVSGITANLYQNHVIIRHEDSGSMTIDNLDNFDSGGDSDVQFTSVNGTPDTLTVNDGHELYILAGDIFTPGGNVTVDDIKIVGTYTATSSEAITVSGNWINSGTFTASTSAVTFDGNASANQTVTTGGQTFYNFTTNNDEATYDDIIISGALDINNTLTITDGNLEFSTNNPNINTAGNVTIGASGAATKGTGTWTFDGGSQAYTDSTSGAQDIGIVTIGPSTTTTVTTVTAMKVTNLTIGADDTFDITDDTLEITGSGTPFVITAGGAFTTTSSTVKYTSSSDTYITQTDYHNLQLGPGL